MEDRLRKDDPENGSTKLANPIRLRSYSEGVGGRSGVWYGCQPESAIDGRRFTDPPDERPENFNRREWLKTPFGMRIYTGAYLHAEVNE